jgi:8-oxo-dGTP diphosphatase
MNKSIRAYLETTLKEVSIDCVIFGFHAGELKVLLLKWKGTRLWSLPGGRIYPDEAVNAAATRILEERTGLKDVFLQQFYTFGDSNRNKNYSEKETKKQAEIAFGENFNNIDTSKRVISIGYYALVEFEKVTAIPDFYTDECKWWDFDEIPPLLFDHNEMIEMAIKTLRKEIKTQPVGNLLPRKFTLAEIQKLYETILNRKFDRRNFHKLLMSYDFLIKLPEKRTGAANKSPHLYRFDYKKYEKALLNGISY